MVSSIEGCLCIMGLVELVNHADCCVCRFIRSCFYNIHTHFAIKTSAPSHILYWIVTLLWTQILRSKSMAEVHISTRNAKDVIPGTIELFLSLFLYQALDKLSITSCCDLVLGALAKSCLSTPHPYLSMNCK